MRQFDAIVFGAFDIAQTKALEEKHVELMPEHLLYGLISSPQSVSAKAFKKQMKLVEKALKQLPTSSEAISMEQLRAGGKFNEWVTLASSRAVQEGRQEVAERDLLRFLPQILPQLKLNYEQLQQQQEQERPLFLVDLNERAGEGKLDPVVGRSPCRSAPGSMESGSRGCRRTLAHHGGVGISLTGSPHFSQGHGYGRGSGQPSNCSASL